MLAAMTSPMAPDPDRAETGRRATARLEANPLVRHAGLDALQLYHLPNFLSRTECKALIRMIDADAKPSVVLAQYQEPGLRTSYTCDLERQDPEIRRLDARLADLLGIPLDHGEPIQGQRYAMGQQFRAHCDWFRDDVDYWPEMKAQGGQRIWTAMIYLNDVEEGGETWFPRAGIRLTPTRGLLIAWNNLAADGSPNDATLHEARPVLGGTKYIITKWFRERPWTPTGARTY